MILFTKIMQYKIEHTFSYILVLFFSQSPSHFKLNLLSLPVSLVMFTQNLQLVY